MFISRDQTIKPAVSSRYTVHKSIHDMLSMIFSYTPENVWGIYGGVLKVLRRSKGLIRERTTLLTMHINWTLFKRETVNIFFLYSQLFNVELKHECQQSHSWKLNQRYERTTFPTPAWHAVIMVWNKHRWFIHFALPICTVH